VLGAVAAVAVVAIMLPMLWLSRQTGSTDLPSGAPAPNGASPAPPMAGPNPSPPPDAGSPTLSAGIEAAAEADRLWQRGDTTAALAVIRRAANERPGDPAVQAQLSRMQADAERRLADARRAAERRVPRANLATADAHERRAATLTREARQVDAIAQLVAAARVVERETRAPQPRGTERRRRATGEPRDAAPP
jgi:hypothetical protein